MFERKKNRRSTKFFKKVKNLIQSFLLLLLLFLIQIKVSNKFRIIGPTKFLTLVTYWTPSILHNLYHFTCMRKWNIASPMCLRVCTVSSLLISTRQHTTHTHTQTHTFFSINTKASLLTKSLNYIHYHTPKKKSLLIGRETWNCTHLSLTNYNQKNIFS